MFPCSSPSNQLKEPSPFRSCLEDKNIARGGRNQLALSSLSMTDPSSSTSPPSISNPANSPIGRHHPSGAISRQGERPRAFSRRRRFASAYAILRCNMRCLIGIVRHPNTVCVTNRPLSNNIANSVQVLISRANRRFVFMMSPALQPAGRRSLALALGHARGTNSHCTTSLSETGCSALLW